MMKREKRTTTASEFGIKALTCVQVREREREKRGEMVILTSFSLFLFFPAASEMK